MHVHTTHTLPRISSLSPSLSLFILYIHSDERVTYIICLFPHYNIECTVVYLYCKPFLTSRCPMLVHGAMHACSGTPSMRAAQ